MLTNDLFLEPKHCVERSVCAYRVKESTQASQRDRDLQSHQPVPSGSCPLSPTTTCGHCRWDWAVPQARASSFQKIKHLTDSHKLSTATAERRCLTPSLATGCGVGAFQHEPNIKPHKQTPKTPNPNTLNTRNSKNLKPPNPHLWTFRPAETPKVGTKAAFV